MTPYRILVVDDSAFMRKIISDLITEDDQFQIIATAVDGLEAVAAVTKYKPDAITMDLEMPKINGIAALQLIMQMSTAPIIMLSGISETNTHDTIKALQYGAFDFIRKPSGGQLADIKIVGENLLEKLRAAVQIKDSNIAPWIDSQANQVEKLAIDKATKIKWQLPLSNVDKSKLESKAIPLYKSKIKQQLKDDRKSIEKTTGIVSNKKEIAQVKKSEPTETSLIPEKPKSIVKQSFDHLVAIGTSTGGPRALHQLISSLPEDFPAPIVVVQHMPPRFTKSLAHRLDCYASLMVVEAEQDMVLQAGCVYIAPGGFHMEVKRTASGYMVKLSESAPRNGHRPSVDVMIESLVPFKELSRHVVILTGMGSDGTKGITMLAEQDKVSVLAEAEESCIVYGMPRSAVESGHVHLQLPLNKIASSLVQAVLK